mgnify:CR=1 FL=1
MFPHKKDNQPQMPFQDKLGIYVHIPFCRSKCDYCDFYSLAGREERMDAQAAAKGGRWMTELRGIAARSGGRIKDVRGQGLMIGLEMGEDAKKLQSKALKEGILVNVCAGAVVRLIPPLILSDDSMKAFNTVLEDFLS